MDAARRVLLGDSISVVGLSLVGLLSLQLAEGSYPGWTTIGVVLAAAGMAGLLYAIEHDPIAGVVDRTPTWQFVTAVVASVAALYVIAIFGLDLAQSGVLATSAGMGVGIAAYRLRYGLLGPIPPSRLARESDDGGV